MNPTRPSERKEKSIPIAGVILSSLFTLDVLYISFAEIIPMCCGQFVYTFYTVTFMLLMLLHLFPGLILIPVLVIIFIVQAVRLRKNQRYIKTCAYAVLWCFVIFLIGCLISNSSPAIGKTITNVKIQTYKSTIEKIHDGAQIREYADLIGGTKGSEDVAFFQYSTGEHEEDNHKYYTTEYYILYSENSSCDVERIKEHARGLELYRHGRIEMQEIKENWYRLKATYVLNP